MPFVDLFIHYARTHTYTTPYLIGYRHDGNRVYREKIGKRSESIEG